MTIPAYNKYDETGVSKLILFINKPPNTIIVIVGTDNEKNNQNFKLEFILRSLMIISPLNCFINYGYAAYSRQLKLARSTIAPLDLSALIAHKK